MISDYQQVPAPVPLTAGTETVVITNVMDSGAGGQFPQGRVIRGFINHTAGATGGTLTIRIRQNSLTGTLIGIAQAPSTTATAVQDFPFSVQDNSVQGAGTYVLTCTVTGSNGNVNDAAMEIYVPEPYGSAV